MRKFELFILFLLLSVGTVVFTVKAENFYIDNYDVILEVSKNRNVHVKEVITVNFTSPSHGIIRAIPTHHSHISNIRVSEQYSKQYTGSDLELKIGDADILVTGKKSYQIEFDHQLYSNKNEFYYNIIGTDWEVPIQRARFYVKMPDRVEDDKVGLSVGRYGTRGFNGGAKYSVSNAEIWGQTFQPLANNEGITLRIEVPEGYFEHTYNRWGNAVWLGLLLCTLFSFLTWYQYGKDEHVTPVVTFNPPKNITPVEAELIMTEKISDKGLVALIVKLANDGYFKIKSEKQKFALSDFKPYKGNNKSERKLLNLLSREAGNDNIVTDDELKVSANFYSGWTALRNSSITKDDKKRFYEASSMNSFRCFMMLLYILGNILLTVFALMNYNISIEMIMTIIPAGFMLLWFMLVIRNSNIAMIIWGILVCWPFFVPLIMEISLENLSQTVMGIGCVIITIVCYIQMLKPNIDGRLLKGQLLGLKRFIEVAEKKRLETMVEQEPQYFYKILPYAYLLGVSKVWIKQFENIAVQPPVWAIDNGFNISNFDGFARGFNASVMPTVANGGISRSSSSGGGGFSGGGFGGGGGRSW
ncbi:MAG: DUF2207 domain-containing protein [Alphaproteobacteria bacterium]|nr:DUF2207 domain-containing protein [Alphaproteobacteria bacterium]